MRYLAFAAFGAALLFSLAAQAEEEGAKRYNFGTRPHPVDAAPAVSEQPAQAAEEAKAEAKQETKPEAEADKPDDAPKGDDASKTDAPAKAPSTKPKSKVVNGVYNPNGEDATTPDASTPATHLSKAQYKDKAERLVRFFIGSCFKFYGRTTEMVRFLDDSFPRLDTDRKAIFAPVVNGTLTTQYWDVVLNGNYYMLAKDTSSGKCDVIAKDGASTAIHKELKAVMDGLTITKIVDAKTDYERLPTQNKEVSIVNVLGHPLEKELGMVATTQIKDTGENMAAILTLFTVPQESVEIKEP